MIRGKDLTSNVVTLQFEKTQDFAPVAHDRTGVRNIDAGLNAAILKPDENVTISGWFSDGKGTELLQAVSICTGTILLTRSGQIQKRL